MKSLPPWFFAIHGKMWGLSRKFNQLQLMQENFHIPCPCFESTQMTLIQCNGLLLKVSHFVFWKCRDSYYNSAQTAKTLKYSFIKWMMCYLFAFFFVFSEEILVLLRRCKLFKSFYSRFTLNDSYCLALRIASGNTTKKAKKAANFPIYNWTS